MKDIRLQNSQKSHKSQRPKGFFARLLVWVRYQRSTFVSHTTGSHPTQWHSAEQNLIQYLRAWWWSENGRFQRASWILFNCFLIFCCSCPVVSLHFLLGLQGFLRLCAFVFQLAVCGFHFAAFREVVLQFSCFFDFTLLSFNFASMFCLFPFNWLYVAHVSIFPVKVDMNTSRNEMRIVKSRKLCLVHEFGEITRRNCRNMT